MSNIHDEELSHVTGGTSDGMGMRCPNFRTSACGFACPYLNTPGCNEGYRYSGPCRMGQAGKCATVLCRLYNTQYCVNKIIN